MSDLKSMFARIEKNGRGENGDENGAATKEPEAKKAKKGTNNTIEKTYQKKSQLEHILLRPDTYIGSVQTVSEKMWIYDTDKEHMIQKEITFVPGLYKIFDEILVNAADNKQRDKKMDCIKVDINAETNTISIWNNGEGIPVVMHQDEKMFVPTMIFGHLLTSSNYNDEEEKVTGGRNGYGAKLCNIFSSKFTVETASKKYKKQFKQVWGSNMAKASEPKIKEFMGEDFTKITFEPDLSKFKMEKLDSDIVGLLSRRAFDIAASTRGVKVILNGKRLPIKNFKDYIEMYLEHSEDGDDKMNKVVYENCGERWEVGMASSNSQKGFQQVSFVNSIATTKGGRHVDYITDMIVKQLIDVLKKKNKGGIPIKPNQVKSHMWVFVNCLIVNPTFDSQTKDNMTLQIKSFGSKCVLSDKFIANVVKCGIVEEVLSWAKNKEQIDLIKTSKGKKKIKLKGIPKLEDANEAGSQHGLKCTLILTEGDSAKSLAVSGLGVIGRDYYGVFPLRGKLLNVREATHRQILDNAEINNLTKILGLQYKKKYNTEEDMKTLRYGKIMIMTDQDQDGSHIKGLIINYIHFNWPELLQQNFIEEFITPIVKATKKNEEHSFYSLPEFEEWKMNTANNHTYHIKYYKGLGTSTSKEAKEYFSNMTRHRIRFKYNGKVDDDHIVLAFSRKHIEQRKEWLTNFMVESKRRKELNLPDKYLYTKDTRFITYTDFINLEFVLYSNADNVRSIPCLVDGFKPGHRKIIFTCIKRNDKREVKVAQLAGSVAEHSAYHHGEQSLCMSIVTLAQNYVGSNNINLLEPRGQFGTRLAGGKDSASPRYIFTKLSPLTRLIFHPHDDALLKHEMDDNKRIEPVWYIPIIPMVLVNGAEGIGTGWSTKIPNFNPRELVSAIRGMLDDAEPQPLMPWYKNFKGTIDEAGDHRYVVSGEVARISHNQLEITELPIGTWTQKYKEDVMELLLNGNEKVKSILSDYREYNTDTTVRFLVTVPEDNMEQLEKDGVHTTLKLQTSLTTSTMCLFDELGCLRRFDTVQEILKEFFALRLKMYHKRKEHLEGILQAEAERLSDQARFIMEKCNGKLVVENKKRKTIIDELIRSGYRPDPVADWKARQVDVEKDEVEEDEEVDEDAEGASSAKSKANADKAFNTSSDVKKYDYLLGMSMWMLTEEKKNELLRQRDVKLAELDVLKKKTPGRLWREDLDVFMEKLDAVELQERKDEAGEKPIKKEKGGPRRKKNPMNETLPTDAGTRIAPVISNEMKKKYEKIRSQKTNAAAKRIKKEEVEVEGDEFDGMVKNKKTLKEKLGTPEFGELKGKNKKTKDGLKQTKINFPKKDNSPAKANGKKRGKANISSDEDLNNSDSGSDVEFSSISKVTPPIVRSPRRLAAKPIRYNLDSDEEDENEEVILYDNENLKDADVKQERMIDSSDEELPPPKLADTSEDMFDKLIGKKSDEKHSTSPERNFAPKKVSSDSDTFEKDIMQGGAQRRKLLHNPLDFDSDGSEKDIPKPSIQKRKLAPKIVDSDSEFSLKDSGSDSDFAKKKPKKVTSKAKKRTEKEVSKPKKGRAKPKKIVIDSSDDSD